MVGGGSLVIIPTMEILHHLPTPNLLLRLKLVQERAGDPAFGPELLPRLLPTIFGIDDETTSTKDLSNLFCDLHRNGDGSVHGIHSVLRL